MASQRFAARDTPSLVPSQLEIDRYFSRMSRAIDAEPQFARILPNTFRHHAGSMTVMSTNKQVIAAWTQASLLTGVPIIDASIAEVKVAYIDDYWTERGGVYSFVLRPQVTFNEEKLHTILQGEMSSLPEILDPGSPDASWSWHPNAEQDVEANAATAVIEGEIGWGDCISGCIYRHGLRAIVPADGPAVVYDLGGDPMPPGEALASSTLPPP